MDESKRKGSKPLNELAEETRPLYVAQFDDWPGTIFLSDGKEYRTTLRGEMLITGQLDQDQRLVVHEIRRYALRSERLEGLNSAIFIAGPANKIDFEPGRVGDVKAFDVSLYYVQLSYLKPVCVDSDALFRPLEKLRGRLTLEPVAPLNDITPQLQVTLTLDELTERHLGLIRGVTAEPWILSLRSPVAQKYAGAKFNSLASCSAENSPPLGTEHLVRNLHVRFYTVNIPVTQILEDNVQTWINDACLVWGQKGGIIIVPDPEITELSEMPANPGEVDQDRIEIYLVTTSLFEYGGGLTDNCGTNNAYIRLEVGVAQNKPNLLAHELGHAMGLYHPGGCITCATYRQGSPDSVMVPGPSISDRNTLNNLMVIEQGASNVLVGDVFEIQTTTTTAGTETEVGCNWNPDVDTPDPLFQNVWISDEALDASYNDAVPETQEYSGGIAVFDANNEPIAVNPKRGVDSENHMFVRLWDCNLPIKPVQVYLYLAPAVPAPPHTNLHPLNDNNGPHITFDTILNEVSVSSTLELGLSQPKTRDVTWTVPDNYPQHCSVFAVGVTSEGASPAIAAIIANPTIQVINDALLDLLHSDNNVFELELDIPFPT